MTRLTQETEGLLAAAAAVGVKAGRSTNDAHNQLIVFEA